MPLSDAGLSTEKQALIALRKMKRRLEDAEGARTQPIAIVGIGCRYPGGVCDLDSYWKLLAGRVDAIREVPASRFPIEQYYHPDPTHPGTTCSKFAGLLDSIDCFDADFFGIAPREAARMDPQQRIFLETVWQALENAGIDPTHLAGSDTAVFAGSTLVEYANLRNETLALEDLNAYDLAGSILNAIAGRVSYVLGLHGPAMAVDTACSSSLVAIDRAVCCLRQGESRIAIAGGVNVTMSPKTLVMMSRWGMLAPDGRCKAFDAAADGFVRAEGCGVIVLKRLSDALADRDGILAVIRGSAVNQDGASSGLTVPNGIAQEMVIRQALANAGVSPSDIGYVEAHGTGTSLGDPIEAEALGHVFAEGRPASRPLLIGSVKTNFGHAEAASGVAGLIKVVLGLMHREVPAQLHWREPSPHIHWSDFPLQVVSQAVPWEPLNGRRMGGVSSFGFSGTNAHVVLEEAPPPVNPAPEDAVNDRPVHLLAVSAKTATALSTLAAAYTVHLKQHPAEVFANVCHTTTVGRAHMSERLSVPAANADGAVHALESWLAGEPSAAVVRGTAKPGARPKIAFLYTGQGSQYVPMGKELYGTSRVFRDAVDRCDEILKGALDASPGEILRGEHRDAEQLIHQTLYTQPLLFTFEYALEQMWRGWGVAPQAVMGHSLGEYVAAASASSMSLEDGLKLVAYRARLMDSVPADGVMLAVEASEEAAQAALSGCQQYASLAAVNGPRQIVISGLRSAVEEIKAHFDSQGAKTKWLRVSQAFHSPLLDGICQEFRARAAAVPYSEPALPLLSNLTGGPIRTVSADYWTDHMRRPVRFHSQITALRELGYNVFLEIGPRPVLIGLTKLSEAASGGEHSIPSLRGGMNEWQALARAVQEIDAAGVNLDWAAWDREYGRRRVALPTYPFARERHWLPDSAAKSRSSELTRPVGKPTGSPLLGVRMASALRYKQFENRIAPDGELAWIGDHRVGGRILMPATGYLETMLAAGANALGADWRELADVVFMEPLGFEDGAPVIVQVIVEPPEGDSARVTYHSAEDSAGDHWKLHAEGRLIRIGAEAGEPAGGPDRCTVAEDPRQLYAGLWQRGIEFGTAFQVVDTLRTGEGESTGEIRVPAGGQYLFHPAALDGCLQAASTTLRQFTDPSELLMPLSVGRFRLHASPDTKLTCYARAASATCDNLSADIRIVGANNQRLADLDRVRFRRASRVDAVTKFIYRIAWMPREQAVGRHPVTGNWLILADRRGAGAELARRLEDGGAHCTLVYQGEDYETLAETAGGIVHLWSLDAPHFSEVSAATLLDAQTPVYGTALRTAQALLRRHSTPAGGLWFITRGAHSVLSAGEATASAAAPLWSLRRTLAAEARELRAFAVDLDPADDALDLLASEIGAADEPEVSIRAGKSYVARLCHLEAASDTAECRRIVPSPTGSLDELRYLQSPRVVPKHHEVEIAVRAAGLNFRDVLNALGMLPGNSPILGGECAGVVVRAGDASGFQPGDHVIAFAPGVFGSYVIAPAATTVAKLAGLSFSAAASLPIAYLTVLYGLKTLAHLRSGDTVLIHAGAGGVGLAAIQVALAAGATVYATAGTEEKRRYLLSLGVRQAMNSRTLDFAAEVLQATDGRGVDIVLNSLAGDFIAKSLATVATGGRFLELGKRDILMREEAARLRPDVSYLPFDLGDDGRQNPALIPALMRDLVTGLANGEIKPLPITLFSMDEACQAFRFMAQAKHTGKIVLVNYAPRLDFGSPATYLITGGLGALGLQAARWLAAKGARSLLLLSRQAPDATQAAAISELEDSGVNLMVARGDCADREALTAVLAQIPATAPLRGVVHCAGILEDAILPDQSIESFRRVAASKALGAWHLHELAPDLDFLVMFSSASATIGSAGQANYSAANGLMDAIAAYRRNLGFPSLSINWGPWEGPGMAAAAVVARRISGMDRIAPAAGFAAIEQLMAAGSGQATVLPVPDWDACQWRDVSADPFFSRLRRHVPAVVAGDAANAKFSQLLAGEPPADRRRLLLDHLARQTRRILGLPDSRTIDETGALHDLGLDSLMSVELRNALNASLGMNMPATAVLDHPTLDALATRILRDLCGPLEPTAARPAALAEIAAMTEEEAEAKLAAELGMNTNAAFR